MLYEITRDHIQLDKQGPSSPWNEVTNAAIENGCK